MSEKVRRACVHGRYERHLPPAAVREWVRDDDGHLTVRRCDPWGEGKNTLQLRVEDDFFGGKRWKERWVSEWEPADG